MIVPIIFPGGCQGTFLQYILDTYSTIGVNKNRDFLSVGGSAHNYQGSTAKSCQDFVTSHKYAASPFIKTHPKSDPNDSIEENIKLLLEYADKVVYVYPFAEDTHIIVLNNLFSKLDMTFERYLKRNNIDVQSKIYNPWGISYSVEVNDIDRWVQREFLSLYMFDSFIDEIEYHNKDIFMNMDGVVCIDYSWVLNDFNKVMSSLSKIVTFNDYDHICNDYNLMLDHQEHINKYNMIQRYINGDGTLVNPSVIDEAYIQHNLRKSGYEIKCDGLNEFPTLMKDLVPLLSSI